MYKGFAHRKKVNAKQEKKCTAIKNCATNVPTVDVQKCAYPMLAENAMNTTAPDGHTTEKQPRMSD